MIAPAQAQTIKLIAATPALLRAALAGSAALAATLGVRVAAGWAESRTDSLRYALQKLEADPDAAGWWTYFLLYQPDNQLVGSGGYHGPPLAAGTVELGYEIAETYRGRGLAGAFAAALVDQAFQQSAVQRIVAHTLAEVNASTRILEKNGFVKVADLTDPDEGPVWQWQLPRPALSVPSS